MKAEADLVTESDDPLIAAGGTGAAADGASQGLRGPAVPREKLRRRAARVIRRLGPVGPLAIVAMALPAIGGMMLYGRLGPVGAWFRSHPVVGPLLCAVLFAGAGTFAVAPTYAMSALCGWSFGFRVGLATTMSAFVTAAVCAYALARAADGGRVVAVLGESPKWRAVHAAVTGSGFAKVMLVVALVRLTPAAPFSLTNLLMASMRVPALPFAAGTALGMTPRTALLVYAASKLSSVDAPVADEPWLYATGVAATVAVLVALGWIGKTALARVTAERLPAKE